MARFNRYILWEICKLFVIALVAFTTLMMLFAIAKEGLSQSLGVMAIIELIPYVLPSSLQYSIPATLLFAVCSVFGRISADNEILAITAAGVPPMMVVKPVVIASLLLSLFSVWLNDVAVSWGRPGINRVIMHSIEQIVYGVLASQGSYTSNSGLTIHVHGIGEDGRELLRPMITIPRASGPMWEINARSARIMVQPDREVLVIQLEDTQIESGEIVHQRPGPFSLEIQLSDATRKGTAASSPAEFAIRQLSAEMKSQEERILHQHEEIAARTAMGLSAGKLGWLHDVQMANSLGAIRHGNHQLTRLRVEPWRRWAFGFSCLAFVWVGIPLSIWMRSADHWTSFGVCFLPILLVFFPIFAMGLTFAKEGTWPPATVWLGNLALLLSGAWWLRKVYRG